MSPPRTTAAIGQGPLRARGRTPHLHFRRGRTFRGGPVLQPRPAALMIDTSEGEGSAPCSASTIFSPNKGLHYPVGPAVVCVWFCFVLFFLILGPPV